MKTRWRPFLFGDMDYRAARLWLEEQGAQGWRLDKVFGRLELVRFVQADAPVHYDAVLRRGGAGGLPGPVRRRGLAPGCHRPRD